MFSLLRRAAAKLNRHLGMSFGQTYLYRLSKANRWSAAPHDGRLKWELLSPAQVGQLTAIGWFDVKEGQERLRCGDRCYTVSIDGRLAHYSWVQRSASHRITEAGVSVPVERGAFWIFQKSEMPKPSAGSILGAIGFSVPDLDGAVKKLLTSGSDRPTSTTQWRR